MTLKILHISDVHFGVPDPYGEQPRITESLIEALHKDGTRPDLCIFSGDLAFSGTEEQFLKGQQWLSSLILKEWNTQLIIIPGNHDIERQKTNAHLFRKYSSDINTYNAWRETSKELPQMSNFLSWHQSAQKVLPLRAKWDSPYGFYLKVDLAPIPVNIIGLNSAIFACNDADAQNLVIDTKVLNDCLKKATQAGGLVIAVAHHPLNELVDWNKAYVEQTLGQERGAHIFFHGHLHEQSSVFRADSTGSTLVTLAGGAAYQDPRRPRYFSIHTLDFDQRLIDVRVYGYSPNSGEWVTDTSRSRSFPANIPLVQKPSIRKTVKQPITPPEPVAPREEDKKAPQSERLENEAWRFREAAKEVETRLLPYFRELTKIAEKKSPDNCYALKNRVKNKDRIIEKVNESIELDSSFKIDMLGDICGFRIITYYSDQIPSIVDKLLKTIRYDSPRYPGLFLKDRKVRLKVITSKYEHDPSSIAAPIKKIADGSGLDVVFSTEARPTGYSSVHIIATAHVPAGDYRLDQMHVEIQIRSALEDVWGEIDWKLRYGSKRGKVGGSWNHHLNIFKNLIDALVTYVDVIKNHSEEPPLKSSSVNARTVGSPAAQMERLRGLPEPQKLRIEQAFDLWKQADTTIVSGGNPGLLHQAADAFATLLIEFEGQPKENAVLAEEFQYVVETEAAYLLTFTGDSDDLLRAESLYLNVLSRRPEDGTANFRLAGVYLREHFLDKAIHHYERAIEIIENGADKRLGKNSLGL